MWLVIRFVIKCIVDFMVGGSWCDWWYGWVCGC